MHIAIHHTSVQLDEAFSQDVLTFLAKSNYFANEMTMAATAIKK